MWVEPKTTAQRGCPEKRQHICATGLSCTAASLVHLCKQAVLQSGRTSAQRGCLHSASGSTSVQAGCLSKRQNICATGLFAERQRQYICARRLFCKAAGHLRNEAVQPGSCLLGGIGVRGQATEHSGQKKGFILVCLRKFQKAIDLCTSLFL